MDNKCWYETNIEFDKNFTIDKLPKINEGEWYDKEGIWKQPLGEVFSEEWNTHLKDLGFSMWPWVLMFYRRPHYYAQRAHVDLQDTVCGINWVIGGSDSHMIWYKKTGVTQERDALTSVAFTPYLSWPVNELEEIERHTLSRTKITLVRVDIPHAIEVRSEDRWGISVRPKGKTFRTWEDTIDYFRSKNLLIER